MGALSEDIVVGKTGFLCRPRDPVDLAKTIATYFESDLFRNLSTRRRNIQAYANARHSWDVVGQETLKVYAGLIAGREDSRPRTETL